jgi:hypothetical protein
MKRKYVLGAILSVTLLGGALVYLHGGGQVPSGQVPLQSLTSENVSAIQNAFNAATGDARVLLLLSPT